MDKVRREEERGRENRERCKKGQWTKKEEGGKKKEGRREEK
jgi:hypothetical protein